MKKGKSSIGRSALAAATALLLIVSPAMAQEECHPGDVNCNSVETAADIIYLVNYCFKSGPPPCSALAPPSGFSSAARSVSRSPETAVPGMWDTLLLEHVNACAASPYIKVRLYCHNHDSLLTLNIPLRIERISGEGFIRFDSGLFIDRIWGPNVMDEQWIAPMLNWDSARSAVDGVSPDWVYVMLQDYGFGYGEPPLDSGAGYLCELFFTPIGGPAEVRLVMNNWGIYPEVGMVEFQYAAREFALSYNEGFVRASAPSGTGDMNGDFQVTVSDIFALVNYVFKS